MIILLYIRSRLYYALRLRRRLPSSAVTWCFMSKLLLIPISRLDHLRSDYTQLWLQNVSSLVALKDGWPASGLCLIHIVRPLLQRTSLLGRADIIVAGFRTRVTLPTSIICVRRDLHLSVHSCRYEEDDYVEATRVNYEAVTASMKLT